jgi:hypothetical protein
MAKYSSPEKKKRRDKIKWEKGEGIKGGKEKE